MAKNILSQNPAELIQLGPKMQKGIETVGATVPVTMTTAAEMGTNTAAFAKVDGDFNAGRSLVDTASTNYQTALDALYPYLLGVSNLLATVYGTRWNTQWAQGGWINNTTAIPAKISQRITLALRIIAFFTKNPKMEVPEQGLTAAAGNTILANLDSTQQLLTQADKAQKIVGDAWDTAYNNLTTTMQDLLANLDRKLEDNDPRWLDFGLRMPSTIVTPGQPQNVTAHLDETGNIIVQCDAVTNATRYRFRMMLSGIETDYRLVASATEPMASIGPIKPGQTAQIIVQAVDNSLQGVASEPVLFTMLLPQAKAAAAVETVEIAALPAVAPANGTNGHANGKRMPALK